MTQITTKRMQLAALGVAFSVAAVFTVTMSMAAFSDTTINPDNGWDSGTVVINDNLDGTAMFNANNIVPGYSESQTITVTNSSSVDTEVALYADVGGTGLEDYLTVVVTRDGAEIYNGGLTGMPADFASAPKVSETGVGDDVNDYVFVVEFPTGQADVDDVQGSNASATFTWEARSVQP